jgi:citrate lyase subunit beta/citryl-CoA lyase
MRADKRMLFEFPLPQAPSSTTLEPPQQDQLFRDHLLSKGAALGELGSQSLAALRPGQLIFHSMQRSLTLSQSQQLSSLAKLTHERHFDVRKYSPEELLIPGGLVLGLTMSAASRDLHEVLHEELVGVQYVNHLNPGNVVGAISYIKGIDENVVPGDLECVHVRTIGIKNMNIVQDLDGIPIPMELFVDTNTKPLKPKEIELLCKTKCPKLSNRIIVQMDRRIIRQTSRPESLFLL